ncbi:GDSL-like Lipase/Acylhydrolase family protein [Jatrophihabitans endophyticus]|uniref:GDSL-like Lipase/Acylhydrolase family protein n=1 Tax=Jatrophihabitans endophyticus TaxID=1206085 RepID=A0A1M5LJ41_9ACTN|nr:SGNH/GDSL hydrolase family protein [Jatrophihabitans endophyticus]SHG64383.1 GDSL-like Lipase/Acylhydrolase family protein [Jatrophihabitans endophyticus]
MRRIPVLFATLVAALGAVLALASPVAAAAAVHYVALGDSYSSGVGAGDYVDSSGSCDRSTNAYSQVWADAHSPASYTSVACSGATTADVVADQLSALSATTTLVSITIGGNDEDFAGVMKDCNLKSDDTCVSEIDAAEADARSALSGKLDSLFAQIRDRSPDAELVVLNYPDFYDLDADCVGLSQTKRTKIDEGIDVLSTVLSGAASRAGATFADVRPAFAGHEICDDNRWLHSVNFADFGISYHPTEDGHRSAYYPTFAAAA